jgi:hypothetical protein
MLSPEKIFGAVFTAISGHACFFAASGGFSCILIVLLGIFWHLSISARCLCRSSVYTDFEVSSLSLRLF